MDKKTLIFTIIYAIAFIGAIVKMVIDGHFNVIPILCTLLCGAYGVKRLREGSFVGELVMGLCILLMGCIIFEIQL
ncbi:MAG: hypothetical protein MJ146_03250 [Clostridia bacterium]|nr:hypothetical protein [Clostridia bacterium]